MEPAPGMSLAEESEGPLVRAAQYVRMSTEHQKYSSSSTLHRRPKPKSIVSARARTTEVVANAERALMRRGEARLAASDGVGLGARPSLNDVGSGAAVAG